MHCLTFCWVRNTRSEGADSRLAIPGKASALQLAFMKFADNINGHILNPTIGTEFDSCDEAYQYYNLYSWECGFGIRWGTKRCSLKKRKKNGADTDPYQLGQDFYCSCRVRA